MHHIKAALQKPSAHKKDDNKSEAFIGPRPHMMTVAQKAAAGPASTSTAAAPPSDTDILRYRYHYAANLGAVYVLERWLQSSAYPSDAPADQTSELGCVSLWVEEIGLAATQAKFEQRWASAMSEQDWEWLANTGHCKSHHLTHTLVRSHA